MQHDILFSYKQYFKLWLVIAERKELELNYTFLIFFQIYKQ